MNIDLDFKIIGLRIQKRRTEMKMTQAELAERIDTNQKHLSRECCANRVNRIIF